MHRRTDVAMLSRGEGTDVAVVARRRNGTVAGVIAMMLMVVMVMIVMVMATNLVDPPDPALDSSLIALLPGQAARAAPATAAIAMTSLSPHCRL